MVRFNYGSDPKKQIWRLSCDCYAIFVLEEKSGKTVEEFFALKDSYESEVSLTVQQLHARVEGSKQAEQVAEALRTPDGPPVPIPKADSELNLLLSTAAHLLLLLRGVTTPRRQSDWFTLAWAMTASWREDAGIDLTFREFLRVIPTGPAGRELVSTMVRLYGEYVKGVEKAVALGNGSASGQTSTGPESQPATTGPGANTRQSVWLDGPEESSGEAPSPPTTPA